jgi:uncharacterized membrane protein (UPF0182 family)
MPDELKEHLRYPEDLFRIQTTTWGRYHLDDAQAFYKNSDGWNVAREVGVDVQSPSTVQSSTSTTVTNSAAPGKSDRIEPFYQLMRLPDSESEEFLLLRPFVPVSESDEQPRLTAFMVAKSDPDNYGDLEVFEMPADQVVDGPDIVASNILSNTEIASRITLLNKEGSRVRLGNLLLLPINQSLIYVRPLYVEASGATAVPELRNVIVAYGDQITLGVTLREALIEIFGSAPDTLENQTEEGTPPPEGTDNNPPPEQVTIQQLLDDATELFTEADAALQADPTDFETYGAKIAEAREKLEQARQLAAASLASPTTTTTTTQSSTTTTTSTPPASA